MDCLSTNIPPMTVVNIVQYSVDYGVASPISIFRLEIGD